MELPAVRKYTAYNESWGEAVSQNYGVSAEASGEILTCALYGYTCTWSEISGPNRVIPFVERLADDVDKIRRAICADGEPLVRYFADSSRKSPLITTFFYKVSQKEGGKLTPGNNPRSITSTPHRFRAFFA